MKIPSCSNIIYLFLFYKRFIYLFFIEKGRERERVGEKHQCVVASHVPLHWGPGLQPRHVPWLGIKPVTLWFTGRHSIHWATPARAPISFILKIFFLLLPVWYFFLYTIVKGKLKEKPRFLNVFTPLVSENYVVQQCGGWLYIKKSVNQEST